MNAVETRGLTKRYGPKTAVDGLDLSIGAGEIYALLGVNGAGKTTTIRMLTGLSQPTAGTCFVCGKSCQSELEAVKALTGISPQDTAVAENLTVRENLQFMCGVHGFPAEKAAASVARMERLFGLDAYSTVRAKTLSGGWKRRLSIAMALIGEPQVLFLDEPTLGLDVLARRELWRVIAALKGSLTIVLTTHYMEEAEHLADRIGVMASGTLRAEGTLSELEARTGERGLENVFVKIAGEEGDAL